MTQPALPTPGAPANEPTPQSTPPAPAPAPTPPAPPTSADPPANPAEDLASLPDWAQKAIRDARAEAGKARTTAKQTAADEARTELAKQVAKALGIDTGDEAPDPAALTQQIEQAQASAWRSGVELQVYRAAGPLGGNPEALLDSLSFIDSLDDLVEVDPSSPDFATQLQAKITAAVERNPNLKAGQAPAPHWSAPRGPLDQPPAPGAPRPDPSQGSRGAPPQQRPTSMSDAIAKHYAGR